MAGEKQVYKDLFDKYVDSLEKGNPLRSIKKASEKKKEASKAAPLKALPKAVKLEPLSYDKWVQAFSEFLKRGKKGAQDYSNLAKRLSPADRKKADELLVQVGRQEPSVSEFTNEALKTFPLSKEDFTNRFNEFSALEGDDSSRRYADLLKRLSAPDQADVKSKFLPKIKSENPKFSPFISEVFRYSAPPKVKGSVPANRLPPLEEMKEDRAPSVPRAPRGQISAFDLVAPMNQLHDESEDLLRRSIDQGRNRESQDLIRKEIRAARDVDIPGAIQPHMQQADMSLQDFIRQNSPDNSEYINSVGRDLEHKFLSYDMPSINKQYAKRGAFFSGAREAALERARQDSRRAIDSQIAKVRMHDREQTANNYYNQQQTHLNKASLAKGAAESQIDQRMKAAGALGDEDMQSRAIARDEASMLSQAGHARQLQAQNALDQNRLQREKEEARPFREINNALAIAKEMPVAFPPEPFHATRPIPPSPMVGLSSAMNGLLSQQLQNNQRRAAGGPVRSQYAKGGSVDKAIAELKRLNKAGDESEIPYEREMLGYVDEARNQNRDPMAQYLAALSAHQMGNLRNPGKGYMDGALAGQAAYNAADDHNISRRDRAANLMEKIQASRQYQREVFERYHNQMRGQDMTEKHYDQSHDLGMANLAETKRGHDMSHQLSLLNHQEAARHHDMMESRASEPNKVLTREEEKKRAAANAEINQDVRKQLKASKQVLKTTGHMKKILERTNTGPITDYIGKKIPAVGPYLQSMFGAGDQADLNLLENNANRLALEKHAMLSGKGQTVGALSALQATKANAAKMQEANVEATKLDYDEAANTYKRSKFILDFQKKGLGDAVDAAEAYEEISAPATEGEGVQGGSPSGPEERIKVKDPNGVPGTVPASELQKHLDEGYTLIK